MRYMGFRKTLANAGVVCACLFISVNAGLADSLNKAASDAVNFHPDVKVLSANRSAIAEELNAAKGLIRPNVNIDGRYGGIRKNGSINSYGDVGITLRQPLYTGGKYTSETQRQISRSASADNRLQDTIETVSLQTAQAYLEVIRTRRVVQRASQNLNIVRRISSRVRSSVRGGGGNQADLEQADARVYAAQNALSNAQIQARDAESLFITVVGRRPGKLAGPKTSSKRLPRSVNGLINKARNTSPKLMAIRYDAEAAESAIETARAALRPELAVELGARHRNDSSTEYGSFSDRTNVSAMVVLSMSLYNGGIDRSRIREARHRADEAKFQEGSTRLTIERELRLAWNKYHGSKRLVGLLLKQSKANQRLTRIRLDQYDSGQATLLSVLDAQNEAFVAGVQATNEYNAGRFAYFKMLAAAGKLASTLGVTSHLE